MKEQNGGKVLTIKDIQPRNSYEADVLRHPEISDQTRVRLIKLGRRCQKVLESNRGRVSGQNFSGCI